MEKCKQTYCALLWDMEKCKQIYTEKMSIFGLHFCMSHKSGHMIAANSKRLFKNLGVENYINNKLCAYLTWDPYIDQTLKILSLCLRTPIFTKPNLCNLRVFFSVYFCLHSSISHKSAQYVSLHFSISHKSAHITV